VQRLLDRHHLLDDQHLSLSPDGRLLAVAGWTLPVPVFDTQTGQTAFVIGTGRDERVPDISWDGSGEYLAVGITTPEDAPALHSGVLIVDRTGAQVGQISGEEGVGIRNLSFRGDGDVVATTGFTVDDDPADQGIRLWDWRRDKLIGRIDGDTNGVVFDPSGQLLATSRLIEGVSDVWDARTGAHLAVLEGGGQFAFDATGTRVATAGGDGGVRIWDARTGELQLQLPLGAGSVWFSPDGKRLVTTDSDVTRVWTLDLDELIDIAQNRVTRDLTSAECRRYLHVGACTQS
jgi:WD40 repeat protein